MNEQYLAIGFLVIVYILAGPLIPVAMNPNPEKFLQNYKRVFWGFHAIVLCAIGVYGFFRGLWWSIAILAGG